MRLSRAIMALSLAFIITISFAALIQKQKNAPFPNLASKGSSESAAANTVPYNLLTFPTFTNPVSPLFIAQSAPSDNVAETPASVLYNATRTDIYDFVKANPGVQFRGICNQLGLSIGLAQFHLGILTKAGLLSYFRDGRYKRFFESKRFSMREMKLISLLRHQTAKNILKKLLCGKSISHGDLAHELSITSQGLTWQMNRLEKEGLIQESNEGLKTIYSLQNPCSPMLTDMLNLVEQT